MGRPLYRERRRGARLSDRRRTLSPATAGGYRGKIGQDSFQLPGRILASPLFSSTRAGAPKTRRKRVLWKKSLLQAACKRPFFRSLSGCFFRIGRQAAAENLVPTPPAVGRHDRHGPHPLSGVVVPFISVLWLVTARKLPSFHCSAVGWTILA